MKSLLLTLLVSSSALSVCASPADTGSFGELPVGHISAQIHANGDSVTAGDSRVNVGLRLGNPSRVLTDGSWLYYNYKVRSGARKLSSPVALIVRFANNRVTRLSLVDSATVVALLEMPAAAKGKQLLAAVNGR